MKRAAWMLIMSVVVIGFLIIGVFPTRTYIQQRRDLAAAEERLEVLAESNSELATRVDELHSDEAIERLAREQYNLVRPGEEAFAILPGPQAVPPPSELSDAEKTKAAKAADPDAGRGFWGDLADTLSFWD